MDVLKTVKVGMVSFNVCKYADGRFGFDYHDESRNRIKGRWRDLEKAITEAKARAKIMAEGRVEMLSVSRQEWAIFEAWKTAGLTIEDISEFCRWKAQKQTATENTVRAVADELLKIKSASGVEAHYRAGLSATWDGFCEKFGTRPINSILPSEVEGWLAALNVAPRTRNNRRNDLVTLFRYARQREYLPDKTTAAEKVERAKIKRRSDAITIWTPAEMRKMLAEATDGIRAWVALAGFAGIRTEELRPRNDSKKDGVRWTDFNWTEKTLRIRPETAKIGQSRFIPLQDNLIAWLLPLRQKEGRVIALTASQFYREVFSLKSVMGETGKVNALRHSYGSYRNAIIRNSAQLAEEMGNSPAMIKRHYEHPQPRTIAEEWFGITPTDA